MNEGVFDLPEIGLVDKTEHFFSATLAGDGEDESDIALLITRRPLPPDKGLLEMVRRYVEIEAKKLRAYRILEERETEWAGLPSIDVTSRYRNQDTMAYQRHAHIAHGGQWLIVAVISALPRRGACDRVIERVLSTLKLREM